MAFGPDKTIPLTTVRERILCAAEKYIDKTIALTEGDTVSISMVGFPLRLQDVLMYAGEIVNMYKNAGWKYVWWEINECDPWKNKLLLSNNPANKDKVTRVVHKKRWFCFIVDGQYGIGYE